jgi:hypothetical protein
MYGLPASTSGLSEFMEIARPRTFVDSGGWFLLRDGKTIFAKGKNKGQPLTIVAQESPDYLRWILGLDDVPEDTKQIIMDDQP